MELSNQLQEQISVLAYKYGCGWDGDDMASECRLLLLQLPETKKPQALTICKNKCIDILRTEEVRACQSTDDDSFFEPVLDGRIVDKEKYIAHIRDLRLRAIVDRYIESKSLCVKDRFYLYRHRFQLDRDLRKYLKPLSPWMILVRHCEPFRRTSKQLKEAPVF